MVRLGLDPAAFTPYCLRRGGATFDFISTGSIDRALIRGRCQSVKCARIYVKQGEELLTRISFTMEQKADFDRYAEIFRTFVRAAARELAQVKPDLEFFSELRPNPPICSAVADEVAIPMRDAWRGILIAASR